MTLSPVHSARPSTAFVGASWAALLAGTLSYLVGLYNAGLDLTEKGLYLSILCLGLFAAVSLQKSVRDRLEGIRVSALYFALCWVAVAVAIALLVAGLWNEPTLLLSEKGFYGMAFTLAMFAAVAVQKNVRDLDAARMVAAPPVAPPTSMVGY